MSLRYRLFLWIACIFFSAFIISMFLESWITRRNIKKIETDLTEKMIEDYKVRQHSLQGYLSYSLSDSQSEIDALLLSIIQYPQVRESFDPSKKNMEEQTWFNATSLHLNNKWIAFLQNTLDGQLGSLVIPKTSSLHNAQVIPLKGNSVWVRFPPSDRFYVGIPIPIIDDGQANLSSKKTQVLLMLEWNTIKPILEQHQKNQGMRDFHRIDSFFSLWGVANIPTFINALFNELSVALEGIQESFGDNIDPGEDKIIQEKLANSQAFKMRTNHQYFKEELIDQKIEENMKQSDQIVMTWALSALTDLLTGSMNPYHALAPSGVIRSNDDGSYEGFLSHDVFYDKIVFDDRAYFNKNSPFASGENIAQSIAVIAPQGSPDVFLGNVLRLTHGEKEGFFTIGIDGNSLMRDLSELMHEDVVLVSNNAVVCAYTASGVEDDVELTRNFPIQELMPKEQGLITLHGSDYYFMHLRPFPHIDLHFFILNPKEKAFALLNNIDTSIKGVIHNLSFYMQMVSLLSLCVAIIVLHRFSRDITMPITGLAAAAKKVGQGELDNITLPKIPPTRKDEIFTLCTSFEGMIVGLREKEQVKGVLNKVVSPDIAQEILQSPLHLGGEEKEITILFADIRHFTSMTEHMAAQDVITLLNQCMSKISTVIDQHHGVIDKYVGDAVMALFGIPKFNEHCTLDAVMAATEIVKALKEWNSERKKQGLGEVTMGIGIHTGKAILGNMGSENRLNYTAIGSNVNLASRICSISGEMQILVSESVYHDPQVAAMFTCEKLDEKMVKGFEKPIPLYAVKEKHV